MPFENSTISRYMDYTRKKFFIGIFLCLALFSLVIISIKIGAADLSFYDIINALFNRDANGALIIWNIRIPRILAAIIAGVFMGIEGAVMQCVLRNPLASPYTMGISNGYVAL